MVKGKLQQRMEIELGDLQMLDDLSDADAIEILNSSKAKDWATHWEDCLLPVLSRLGLDALPFILEFATRFPAHSASALAQIDSPGVAPHLAGLLQSKKNRELAEDWFSSYPEAATVGLLSALLGKKKKAKSQGQKALQFLH